MSNVVLRSAWLGAVTCVSWWLLDPWGCPAAESAPPVKNVIVLIADGCGAEQYLSLIHI